MYKIDILFTCTTIYNILMNNWNLFGVRGESIIITNEVKVIKEWTIIYLLNYSPMDKARFLSLFISLFSSV